MANADFDRSDPGFASQAFGAADAYESPVRTPLQRRLAAAEAHLPAPLTKPVVAVALCLVLMLGGAVGLGGAKLRGAYNQAKNWYTAGVPADGGYTLSEELAVRENTAANVLTTAQNQGLADSPEYQAAQTALQQFSACRANAQAPGGMHTMYEANAVLGAAVDQLYAALQQRAEDPMKMGAVQGQYGQFNSAGTILGELQYNKAVSDYQNKTSGGWAAVLKGLFGVQEVEQFV